MSKDTHHTGTADQPQVELPAAVTVVVAELAGAARQGLLALAVGTGLQVLQAMMDEDVTRLVGAKGRHNPERAAVRHGSEPGRVTLGGRRVRVRRPRVRTADGTREVPLPSYQAFASSELLDQMALERMLAKLSTRRYPSAQGEHRTADADEPARQVPLGEQVGKLLGGHPEGDHEGEVEQQLQRCRGTVRLVWVAPIMRVTPWASACGDDGPDSAMGRTSLGSKTRLRRWSVSSAASPASVSGSSARRYEGDRFINHGLAPAARAPSSTS